MKAVAMLTLLLIAGCADTFVVEETALLSFDEQFCVMTETSARFAHTDFLYEENGDLIHIRTKTSCKDFPGDEIRKTIFGERITITYSGADPVAVTREDGRQYDVELSAESVRNFFQSDINPYDRLDHMENPRSTADECRRLENTFEREWCIAYQAAFQQNAQLCPEAGFLESACVHWVSNLESG